MKIKLLFALTALFTLTLNGCNAANSRQEISSPANTTIQKNVRFERTVIIATGDMSGVYFPLGQALAQLFEMYDGAASGTQVTHASIQNMKLVSEKKADLGFSTVDVLQMGNKIEQRNLQALTGLYANFLQVIATKKSGIHSIADLAGKRVSLGTSGSGTKIMAERTLEAAGLTNVPMAKHYLSFSQSADALVNGTIDAAFFSSGLPNPEILSLSNQIPLTFVPISEQVVNRLQQKYGFYEHNQIPQETYTAQQEIIPTLSVKNVLLINKTLSTNEGYELVKTLYEHIDELQQIHPAVKTMPMSEAVKGIPLPFHPGARKFFKEKGLVVKNE
ncbi:TAXI family TRAP transporter solute-binding subunit [Neobacillus sp. SM06]|uniref:TAXI family TRAP transporter solute-binding subunit n=1 Tax=Neobacillus sp. SM06 TaxID=3422492 RepID=UPI003D2CC961